jgi:hypothetical protein
MFLMCVGYLLPFYCFGGIYFLSGFASQRDPLGAAVVCLIFIPIFTLAIGAQGLIGPEGKIIHEKIRTHVITPPHAFRVGLIIGIGALSVSGGDWYCTSLAETFFVNYTTAVFFVGMSVIVLILFSGPAAGMAWLATRGDRPSREKKD